MKQTKAPQKLPYSLNTRAHDKIYAKIRAVIEEIRSDEFDIESALEWKKRELKTYEYILKLINEKRNT